MHDVAYPARPIPPAHGHGHGPGSTGRSMNSGLWTMSGGGETQTRQQRNLQKRPATGEWQQHTLRLLDDARQTKQSSMVLRDQNTTMKKSGDRDVRDTENIVNEELRKKVALTTKLKARLEKQVSQTTKELESLIESRARTKVKLDERRKPLKVAMGRLNTRAERPPAEQINDTVERTLRTEALELQSAVQTLQDLVQTAADVVTKLEHSLNALKSDLRDKTEALRLDKACLDVQPESNDLQYTAPGGRPCDTVATSLMGSRAHPSSKTLEWQSCTNQVLTDAADLEQRSMRLRKVLARTVSSLGQSHLQAYGAVNDALRSKVKQTKTLQSQLLQNLNAVNKELEELNSHRDNIQTTLESKKGPLSVVRQRLELRRQRPAREAVRDHVEEALESELTKLRGVMDSLQAKLVKIEVERTRLMELRRQLEHDIGNKSVALKRDKQALALDLTQVSQDFQPPTDFFVRMAVPAVDQKAIRDASLRETLRWLRSGDMQYDRVAAWMRGNIDVILAAAAFDWEGTLRSASRDSGIAGNAGLYASLAKHTQGHCLKYASEALRDDDDLVKRCLCLDGDTLEHASARLRDDAAMVCLALRTSGQALRYASEQLRGDVGIALKAVTSDWRSLRYTGPDLRDDAVVVRTAVHLHGEALQYASPRCRGDREIVLAAVRNCGTALRHATDAIYHTGDRTRLLEVALTQDDETTCDSDTGVQPLSMFRATIDAPRESPLISRRRASSRPCIGMKRAKELVGEAVRQDGMALQYVHPELRKNSFLGALAVQQTPLALACVGREVRNTRQVVLGAVRRCGAMLQHASEKLRADRDIVSVAVARDGTALGFASFELRSDAAIVGIAVRHTHTALAHATGRLRASKPFILSLVSQNPHCLQYADTSLQSDSTVLAACGAQLQCSLPQAVTQADDVPVHPVPPLRRSHGVVSLLEVAQPPEHLQKRLRRSQGQQSLPRMESAWGA